MDETQNTPILKIEATDIIEHLGTLVKISQECPHITEMGVRDCVSTWAFIAGHPKKLVSIDLNDPPKENLDKVKEICKDKIEFEFIKGDTRLIEIEPTDLLFIDTDHTANHLWAELQKHNEKAKKYIVLHDTESAPELWWAIGQLLLLGKWKVLWHFKNNNGLTVLERL